MANDLWQSEKLGYSYGYSGEVRLLTANDANCRQLANWFAEVWPQLAADVREQIVSLIQSGLSSKQSEEALAEGEPTDVT